MPQFNIQMLTNMLASALTGTFAALLSYLAAWSHFSTEANTGLATVLAAGTAIVIGQVVTIGINRMSWLTDAVAQNGTKVIVPTQAAADALPNNPNVMGPAEAAIVKK